MPNFSISAYISMGLGILLLVLFGYCKVLSSEKTALEAVNTTLTGQVNELAQTVKAKTDALQVCSDNTRKLKEQEDVITADAKIAVAEAQKKSQISYSIAANLIKNKTIVPTITSVNAAYFGGPDQSKKIADCNAAHQLFNDEIDRRTGVAK